MVVWHKIIKLGPRLGLFVRFRHLFLSALNAPCGRCLLEQKCAINSASMRSALVRESRLWAEALMAAGLTYLPSTTPNAERE